MKQEGKDKEKEVHFEHEIIPVYVLQLSKTYENQKIQNCMAW
jgi:hypothetical protein